MLHVGAARERCRILLAAMPSVRERSCSTEPSHYTRGRMSFSHLPRRGRP